MSHIPVVDFSSLSTDVVDDSLDENKIQNIANELITAFASVGFVYLKNAGVPRSLIDKVNRCGEDFFHQPQTIKSGYQYDITTNHGWVNMETESFDSSKPGDLKECFNVTLSGIQAEKLPYEVNQFPDILKELFNLCGQLARRVLLGITIGLRLKDPSSLIECHNPIEKPSFTTMRLLHYPPIVNEVKPGQIRLGEHSDYGSLTLLFQDDIGGLQVKTRAGEWVDATPISDTVLVNIGDMLQYWTSDLLVSTPHRVLIPVDESLKKTKRQSLVFFFHPDNETIIRPLDGSDKYAPVLAGDFVSNKLKKTHSYEYSKEAVY